MIPTISSKTISGDQRGAQNLFLRLGIQTVTLRAPQRAFAAMTRTTMDAARDGVARDGTATGVRRDDGRLEGPRPRTLVAGHVHRDDGRHDRRLPRRQATTMTAARDDATRDGAVTGVRRDDGLREGSRHNGRPPRGRAPQRASATTTRQAPAVHDPPVAGHVRRVCKGLRLRMIRRWPATSVLGGLMCPRSIFKFIILRVCNKFRTRPFGLVHHNSITIIHNLIIHQSINQLVFSRA